MIEYKKYIGFYEFDEEKKVFYGKVINSDDVITFQGKSVKEVKEAFQDAINEYLAWCKKYRNNEPKKPHPLLEKKETRGGGY